MGTKLKHNNLCIINSNHTLKEFLKEELLFSSSSIKKIITNKKLLNKQLRERDEIFIDRDLLNQKFLNPIYSSREIEVIEETNDFIILNKPEGIHGHPLRYSETDTVLNFLRQEFNRIELGEGSDDKERGLLYRLDELTSGVLIYVKDPSHHKSLRENFSELVKKKSYYAIVDGILDIDREVQTYLKGSAERGSIVKVDESGIDCRGHFRTVKKLEHVNKSLIQIELKTGFRHQIRVQLSSLGHPIYGDILYGGEAAKRMFLHAYEYCLGDRCWRAEKNLLFCDLLNLNSLLDVS